MRILLLNIESAVRRTLMRRSTAVGLMAALAGFCVVGLFIPQTGNVSAEFLRNWDIRHPIIATFVNAVQFHHVYSSVLFFVVSVTLWCALLYAVKTVYKTLRRQPDEKIRTTGLAVSREIASDCDGLERFTFLARNAGYKVRQSMPDGRVLVKSPAGRWGSMVFHLGLIVIVTAAMFSFLTQRRGFVQVMEGDTFFGARPEFATLEPGFLTEQFEPLCDVTVEKVRADYYPKGDLKSLRSEVTIGRPGEDMHGTSIGINDPYDIDGLRIYQSIYSGYAVGLTMIRNGVEVPSWFYLDQGSKPTDDQTCSTDFPTIPYFVDLALHSPMSLSPALHIVVRDEQGTMHSAELKSGESLNLGDSRLVFVNARQWTGLIIADQTFVPFVFFGFILSLAGLLMIFVFPTREIIVAAGNSNGTSVIFAGGSPRREKAIWADEFLAMWQQYSELEKKEHITHEPVHI